jgi:Ca2+-binding RTX toxin-like protein
LSANLDNLILEGDGNVNGIGNGLDNRLTGNSGANTLTGGLGRDILIGGLGGDRFDFNALAESGITGATFDAINDFDAGTSITTVDRIDFATIDANALLAGNQAFSFVAAGGAFTAAGQVRARQINAGNTWVEINADANTATVELIIRLIGVTASNINSGDFVL